MSFTHTAQIRVLYADTDQMGVVNNGVYLRWFEAGRCEWLRARGTTYKAIEAGGVMMPVVEATLRYRAPAYYDDLVDIETTVENVRAASSGFRYVLRRHGSGEVLCEGATRHACLGQDGRPTRMPEFLLEILRGGT